MPFTNFHIVGAKAKEGQTKAAVLLHSSVYQPAITKTSYLFQSDHASN